MQINNITFKTLFELGRKYELTTEIRSRYIALKIKDKMIIPEVPYEEKSVKNKIAAIQTPSETQNADTTAQTKLSLIMPL